MRSIRARHGHVMQSPQAKGDLGKCDASILLAAGDELAKQAEALGAVHEALHRRGDSAWEGWECDEWNAARAALGLWKLTTDG